MAQRRQISGEAPESDTRMGGEGNYDNFPGAPPPMSGGPLSPGTANIPGPDAAGRVDPTPDDGVTGIPGRTSEGPRERENGEGGMGGTATPRRPSMPTPAPSNTAQMIPFSPMGDTSANMMASPGGMSGAMPGVSRRSPGLFGGLGGLKGGGLGLPQDPVNSAQNMDISGLIQMLLKGM